MKKCLRWLQSKYNYAGFSLIELCIALAILATLVALSYAQISFIDRIVARAELEQLYTICSYLRQTAMAQNKSQYLVFDTTNHQYHYGTYSYRLDSHVHFGAASYAKGPPSEPTRAIIHPVTFPDNRITFHANGIIEPGTVYLTTRKKQHTYALSCAVAQVSYLRKYQYTDRWITL